MITTIYLIEQKHIHLPTDSIRAYILCSLSCICLCDKEALESIELPIIHSCARSKTLVLQIDAGSWTEEVGAAGTPRAPGGVGVHRCRYPRGQHLGR